MDEMFSTWMDNARELLEVPSIWMSDRLWKPLSILRFCNPILPWIALWNACLFEIISLNCMDVCIYCKFLVAYLTFFKIVDQLCSFNCLLWSCISFLIRKHTHLWEWEPCVCGNPYPNSYIQNSHDIMLLSLPPFTRRNHVQTNPPCN